MSETQNKIQDDKHNKVEIEEKGEIKNEPTNEVKNVEQSEIKKEPTNEVKTEPKSEIKDEPKSEIKNETNSEIKNEQKIEIKNEQKKEEQIVQLINPQNDKIENLQKRFIINKNSIEFDLFKIFSIIKKEGSYKEKNFTFEFYKGYTLKNLEEEENEDIPKYLVDIQLNEMRYIGVLSNNLNKDIYGYNIFDNGDEYFGQWNNDKKEGFGIYYFKEKEEEKIKHIYIGEFKNNVKFGDGLYFKIKKFEEEKENKENINRPNDFTFAIGKFERDNFKEGIIYNIEGEKRQIYRGKMNEKGEKADENAEIYENKNQIFNGEIKDNIMRKGRIIVLNEKDIKKEEAYYFERMLDKNPNDEIEFDYRKGEEKDDELIKKMNDLFEIYDCEKLKDLYIKAIEFREKIRGKENFQYIKDLDYDSMVKDELKKMYGKYFYLD